MCTLTNHNDPDEMLQKPAFHLELHCLFPKNIFNVKICLITINQRRYHYLPKSGPEVIKLFRAQLN